MNIAGIKVGDITDVDLEDGNAVVTMKIEQKYAPLHALRRDHGPRPRTGLAGHDDRAGPGHQGRPKISDGATVPLADTLPTCSPTRSWPRSTRHARLPGAVAPGRRAGPRRERQGALGGPPPPRPTARDLAKINGGLAKRRQNIARVDHDFRLVSEELGARDTQLANFVASSDAALGDSPSRRPIRESLQELPSSLRPRAARAQAGDALAHDRGPAPPS